MTVWYDVSDLVGWPDQLTGIQRVALELAQRGLADGGRLIRFDAVRSCFVEVPDDAVRSMRSVRSGTMRATVPRARRIARGAARRGRAAMAVRVARVRHGDPERREVSGRWHPFSRADVLVVLGLNWRAAHHTALIARLRAELGLRVVLVAYDVIPFTSPHLVMAHTATTFAAHVAAALAEVDLVAAISEATAADLRRAGLIPAATPVRVVRMGTDAAGGSEQRPDRFGVDEPFLVAVGTFEIRKNYGLLYLAYRLAAERGIELPKLVIVGRTGWLAGDTYDVIRRDPVVSGRIVVAHGADEAERRWLLRHCLFTVMTSFAEGWGLPLTESLAYGKTALAPDIPAAHEAAGELVRYCSPYDSGACLDGLVELLDEDVRGELEARIARIQLPTWDDCYDDLRRAVEAVS